MEKLEQIAPRALVEGVVEAKSLVFQVTNLVGVHLLEMRDVLEHVRNHLAQLVDIIQKLDYLG